MITIAFELSGTVLFSWAYFLYFVLPFDISHEERPRSTMAKVLESSLGTYGFELQSPYYEQLQTNTHGKNTNHFIHPSIF